MDQQYTYYTPNQNGSQNPYREPEKKPEKKKKGAPRWVKVACLGLIFGLVASAAFQTSNLVFGRFLGNSDTASAEKTVESARLTTSSGGTAQSDVAKIAQNAMPSVVSITNMSVQQVQNFFGGVQEQEMKSAGSGIIISQTDSELLIVTNNHVVEGSDTLTVTFADEESVEANIKGTDASKDLAVIAVDLKDIKDSTRDAIAVAQMGDSDKIQVGEQAVAIGNALGYGQSVTTGIISSADRCSHQPGQQRRCASQCQRRGDRHQYGQSFQHGGRRYGICHPHLGGQRRDHQSDESGYQEEGIGR